MTQQNSTMQLTQALIEQEFQSSCNETAKQWLAEKLAQLSKLKTDNLELLDIPLAMARRKVGAEPVTNSNQNPFLISWTQSDLARISLLLKAEQLLPLENILARAYKQGDEYEKEAIIKGLCVLDPGGRYLALAQDACRTNVLTLFSAIALHNAYPSRFFEEHEFNQLILKSLFLGLNIGAVYNLPKHLNTSLSRMALDYVLERVAAKRSVPASIWLAIRIKDLPEALSYFEEYLSCDDEEHRYYSVSSAITQVKNNKDLQALLLKQAENETSVRIQTLLNTL